MTAKSEKPEIMVLRRGDQLHPLTAFDGETIRQFPAGKPLRIDPKMPRRSSPQNRLYWSLLRLVCDNLDSPVTPQALHTWLKVKMGVTETIPLRNGEVAVVPGSTAFDSLEHSEFTAYFTAVKALIVEHIIPGANSEAFEREAMAMLKEAA